MANATPDRIAVLIDADNHADASIVEPLLAEIAKYGVATVKRIYGDWTQPNLRSWKDVLNQYAIHPMQQFAYTKGKNATDSALIIDAMDLLYSNRFDAFCIVSSDSDFTRLASRLRESGLTVYGFGERKAVPALASACDKFTYLDVLRGGTTKTAAPAATAKPSKTKPAAASPPAEIERKPDARTDTALHKLLLEAVDDAADEEGWAALGAVGTLIAKRKPDFDTRTWHCQKLNELVEKSGLFEIDVRKSADGKQKAIYLRDNRKKG